MPETPETGWKPLQEWRVRVARFFGEHREFRIYVRPDRAEALVLADDLNRTGQWDSIWIEQRDVLRRPPPKAKGHKKAKKLSAKARTIDMFKDKAL